MCATFSPIVSGASLSPLTFFYLQPVILQPFFLFSIMPEQISNDLTIQSEEKKTLPSSAIVLNTPLGMEVIPIESIVSCSADGKYAFLHHADEPQPRLVYHSLAELSMLLGKHKQFVRCHKSLVLNVKYCTGWRHHRKKDALARVGYGARNAEYNVSRTYKAAFVRAWREWMQKV